MQNPKIKSKVFRTLLPEIMAYKEKGFTPNQIVDLLAEKGLNLTIGTFNLYLFRYSKKPISSNKKNENMINSTLTNPALNYGLKDANSDLKKDDDKSNSCNYEFGTPEHKAKVQAETEELFKSAQKTGLR